MVRLWCCLSLGVIVASSSAPAAAQPVAVEAGWALKRTIPFAGARSAQFNPKDELIYVGSRLGSGADGVFSIDAADAPTQLVTADRVAALLVDADGNVFFSEDYDGNIYRVAYGTTTKETWVSGFHTGDDDPVGMAIAPANHSGGVLNPGEALVVDRGENSSPEGIYRWSPAAPENEEAVRPDDGTLDDPVDVAIDATAIYVVDSGHDNPGKLFTLGQGGALTEVITSPALDTPLAVVIDPSNGDVLIVDGGVDKVLRISGTGAVSEVLSGLNVYEGIWAGLDIDATGQQLLITDKDNIYLYEKNCTVSPPGGATDCDSNGIVDSCDIADGTHADCNANGIPDACDLSAKTSQDCDGDQTPDECQSPTPCADAGTPRDLGADAPAPQPDASAADAATPEPAPDSSGCCSVRGDGTGASLPVKDTTWLLVLGLLLLRGRRRRNGRPVRR